MIKNSCKGEMTIMKTRKSILSILLAIIMLFGIMPMAAAADGETLQQTLPDMPADSYWSAPALKNAVENGLLKGNSKGMLLPGANLTRAEMAAVVVRAFGAFVKGDITKYTDVPSSAWYADEIAIAYKMGIIEGSGGRMRPDDAITRQEVFTIIGRAFKIKEADQINKNFPDADKIASWAKGSVYALVNAGYINGSDGYLKPTSPITREEFAQIFYNMIKQFIRTAGEVTEVSAGNVMVSVPGVTLKDLTVNGDLIIGDGVGDGEVILDNVTVTGRLVIRGGGENSIIIRGKSSVANVIVSRVDGKVSVKVQDDADVEVIYVDDGSDDVSVEGTIGTLEIAADNITVTTVAATIEKVAIASASSKIVVDEKSTVAAVEVKATAQNIAVEVKGTVAQVTTAGTNTAVTGTGTVTKVVAAAGSSGTKIETPKTQIVAESGASDVTDISGKPVAPGSTTENKQEPASGGSGGGTYTPPAESYSLTVDIGTPFGPLPTTDYTYNPNSSLISVINGYLGDADNADKSEYILKVLLTKLESKGLLGTDGEMLESISVGGQSISLASLIENAYLDAESDYGSIFTSATSNFLNALDPTGFYTTSGGRKYLKYNEATYSKDAAAKYLQQQSKDVLAYALADFQTAEVRDMTTFKNLFGQKLFDFLSQTNAQLTLEECKELVEDIRNGISVNDFISALGVDRLTGTFTYSASDAAAKLAKRLSGEIAPGVTELEFVTALYSQLGISNLSITIDIDFRAE